MQLFFLAVDKETTGLEEGRPPGQLVGHVPIEIAARVLKPSDNEGELPTELGRVSFPIRPLLGSMASASEFALNMHKESGLLEKALASTIHVDEAEKRVLDLISEHCGDDAKEGKVVILGNSIHFDRRFIKRYMPKLHTRLHYHQLDVTSVAYMFQYFGIKEPWGDWKKQKAHTADADIDETLTELELYGKKLGLVKEG